MAWSHHAVRAPPQSLPRLPPGPRRLSTASSAVLSNTTSFLRNLHNGAEVRARCAAAFPVCSQCQARLPRRCRCADAPPLARARQIFVVGTAHVSKRSAEEVREMLRLVKPKTVLVELCPQRAARLRASGADDPDFLKVPGCGVLGGCLLGVQFQPRGALTPPPRAARFNSGRCRRGAL